MIKVKIYVATFFTILITLGFYSCQKNEVGLRTNISDATLTPSFNQTDIDNYIHLSFGIACDFMSDSLLYDKYEAYINVSPIDSLNLVSHFNINSNNLDRLRSYSQIYQGVQNNDQNIMELLIQRSIALGYEENFKECLNLKNQIELRGCSFGRVAWNVFTGAAKMAGGCATGPIGCTLGVLAAAEDFDDIMTGCGYW
jgi:hypothetical protein